MSDPLGELASGVWKPHERVFRMSSQTHLAAALYELQGYGLLPFQVHRRSTPSWLLLVVNVEDGAAAVVAAGVVLSVDRHAEQLPPPQFTGD